ncbi:MAG TPA: glycerol-3-phosphate 1-O-acyltransferase PlsY [Dehalococcoidia bacterium]|nr:glycerol-3-phosphate 1-O-acyltransferase PlsY [Dehalococcoidia bacterium]
MWEVAAMAVVGYLCGSIPFGWLMGRYTMRIDVRDFGSGKTGFTNTMRSLGLKRSLVVLVGDILKGAFPVVLARVLVDGEAAQVAAGVGAVVGHIWPVWLGFRGGAGVATGVGAALAMNPFVVLAAAIVFVLCVALVRIMSVASLAGTVALAVAFALFTLADLSPWVYVIFAVVAGGLIWWRHRSNIQRLLAGTEPRIGQRVGPPTGEATTA